MPGCVSAALGDGVHISARGWREAAGLTPAQAPLRAMPPASRCREGRQRSGVSGGSDIESPPRSSTFAADRAMHADAHRTVGWTRLAIDPSTRRSTSTISTFMVTRLSPEVRAARMRAIRKEDTKPEIVVRRIAHRLGLRFRLYRRDLPGSPDLVFPRHRKIVLVHGCFWHQHEGCRLARQPLTNRNYWLPKLARNVERDRQVQAQLSNLGWRSIVIWECETRCDETVGERIVTFLRP